MPRVPLRGKPTRVNEAPAMPWWRTAAIVTSAFVVALALLALAWLLVRPLALLFLAIVVGEAMRPLVARLERRLPRALAVIIVYLALLLAAGGILWVTVPPLVGQARGLITNGPALVAEGREWLNHWDPSGGGQLAGFVQTQLARFSGGLVALPLAMLASLLEIVLVIVLSVYWLLTAPALHRFVGSLVPSERRPAVDGVLQEIGQTMGGYVRATAIDALIVAVLVYVGLRVIGVDFPVVLALAVAVGELIPVAGPIIAAVPALVIALLNSPTQALLVLAFYLVLQQFESHVLMPNIMHKQADVPPLLAMVAILGGATVGGVLGVLIAIPLAGALRVLLVRVVAPAIRQWSGAKEPAGSGESQLLPR